MPATLITSRANPRVKQLRAAFAGQARLSGGLIAIEGEHLLFEAKRSGLAFKTIFISERAALPEWAPRSVELIELTDEVFTSVVDTQSPQGIAALLVPPAWSIDDALSAQIFRRPTAAAAHRRGPAGPRQPWHTHPLRRSLRRDRRPHHPRHGQRMEPESHARLRGQRLPHSCRRRHSLGCSHAQIPRPASLRRCRRRSRAARRQSRLPKPT